MAVALRAQISRIISAVVLLFVLGLAGCVSVPPVRRGDANTSTELASHVSFLAQPALGGRKPRTRGSRLARQYIESRFKACGLIPWMRARDYELPFGFGRNVVGVLPGSDPTLKNEIVLFSAHYDHLGKDNRGRICPGAADNASGVAALLEIAKQISASEQKPKRSIAFAAFDCEEQMLFGSLAFSCRADVTNARIVAVVNIDILGRDFLDVVTNTVFVAGTEAYPGLPEQVCRFGTNAGIRVLPVSSDLVGARSDHASFEFLEVPCLFFSSGIYRDYHQPGDTPDKLHFNDIEHSAKVVLETVNAFANEPIPRRRTDADVYDVGELRVVATVMSEVGRHPDEAGVKKEDLEAFRKLEEEAETLLKSGRYDRRAREQLIIDATGVLVPYLMPREEIGKGKATERQRDELKRGMQYLAYCYLTYPREILDGSRKLVAQIVQHRPGLFRGMPKFEYEAYHIADDDISVASVGDTRSLHVLINRLNITLEVKPSKWLVNSFSGGLSATLDRMDCEGSQEQIADYCLLCWRSVGTNDSRSAAVKKVCQAVGGMETGLGFKASIQRRVERGGFKDEIDWITKCIQSPNPELAMEALTATKDSHDERIAATISKVIIDRTARPDVRAAAIGLALELRGKASLTAMCEVLDDSSPSWKIEYDWLFNKAYPFSNRTPIRVLQPFIEKFLHDQAKAAKTIGRLAHDGLKKACRKDFWNDAVRWRKWVGSHAG